MEIQILLVLLILVLGSVAYAAASGAPWIPTRRVDIEELLGILDLKPNERFYELGCGDGRVCLAVARRFPQTQVIGIELSFLQWLIARIRVFFSGLRNVRIRFGNIFGATYRDADVLYFFLMSEVNAKLAEKFRFELRPGSRVFSYIFPVANWKETRGWRLGGSHPLREYTVGSAPGSYPQST